MTCHNPALGNALGLSTDTPIAAQFKEWLQADQVESETYETGDDDEQTAAMQAKIALELKILAAPKLTAQDVLCAFLARTCFGDFELHPDEREPLMAEALAVLGRTLGEGGA